MSLICPDCGCDLGDAGRLELGNVHIESLGDIRFLGRKVELNRAQWLVVEALVRAEGRYLSRGLLVDIVNTDIDEESITQYVRRARAAFRKIDPQFDQIETLRGFRSYRWRAA